MNRKMYKETFSQVHPSEQAVERIMDMTHMKSKKISKTALIAVAVIISMLIVGGIVAGAKSGNGFTNSVRDIITPDKTKAEQVMKDDTFINNKGEKVREVEFVLDDGTESGFKIVSSGDTDSMFETMMVCAGENGYQSVGIDENGDVVFGEYIEGEDLSVERINEDIKKQIEE